MDYRGDKDPPFDYPKQSYRKEMTFFLVKLGALAILGGTLGIILFPSFAGYFAGLIGGFVGAAGTNIFLLCREGDD